MLIISGYSFGQKKKPKSNTDENVGYIIGSVTIKQANRNTSSQLFYYSNDSLDALYNVNSKGLFKKGLQKHNKIYCVDIDKHNRPYDFKLSKKEFVYLFKIEKPAGKYRFTETELFRISALKYIPTSIFIPVNLPFEIEKGKATYFGNFELTEDEFKIELVNHFQRDSLQIAKKYTELNISNAQ